MPHLATIDNQINLLERVYDNLQSLATRGDTKAGLLLATHAVIVYTLISTVSAHMNHGGMHLDQFQKTALWSCGGFFLGSFSLSVSVLLSRGGSFGKGTRPASLLYVMTASGTSPGQYIALLRDSSDEQVLQDYASNIHDLASIVKSKLTLFNLAVRIFILTTAAWMASVVGILVS
ncbi:MAG TPA: hypothetical protein VNO55_26830, partial [Polyangia bacterium]|nr:hypothetical protein [Polyangia bacterium]